MGKGGVINLKKLPTLFMDGPYTVYSLLLSNQLPQIRKTNNISLIDCLFFPLFYLLNQQIHGGLKS